MAKDKVDKVDKVKETVTDFTSFILDVKSTLDEDLASNVCLGDALTPVEFMPMASWWTEVTGLPGLPIKRITVIAGDSDCGKTSTAI